MFFRDQNKRKKKSKNTLYTRKKEKFKCSVGMKFGFRDLQLILSIFTIYRYTE